MYSINSPRFSFIQFTESDQVISCAGENFGLCLPVYEQDDVHFQFVVQAETVEEANSLCDRDTDILQIGTRKRCSDTLTPFASRFERYRISDLQVLYNWQHGIETLESYLAGDCFYIGVEISGYPIQQFCSNCLQRIGGNCYTSVIEYGNDENAFGFNYCASGTEDPDNTDCSPTVIQFTNQPTLTIPYTTSMQAKYGQIPTVQVWIYNEDSELQDIGVSSKFDTFPPTQLLFDFGGPASGVIKIL